MDVSKRLTPIDSGPDGTGADIEEDGLSLEELSHSYLRALAAAEPPQAAHSFDEATTSEAADRADNSDRTGPFAEPSEQQSELDCCPLTPQSIVESILFVGRPDGGAITASEIAALMRGVHEAEVAEIVDSLNQEYAQTGRATRIVSFGVGYRLQLADELNVIRDRFYGRVREVKLSQAAIDCLALILYQPGLSREKLEQQRGQPSGSILSQLVRRQLIEVRREGDAKKPTQCYYPNQRLLDLAGIHSLDDLPQTEDFD